MWSEMCRQFRADPLSLKEGDLRIPMVYAFLYLGIIFIGAPILIPALYVSLRGQLSLEWVITTALFANITSDMVWYSIGRKIPLNRLERYLFKRRTEVWRRAEDQFRQHKLSAAFVSKFIFGTRIAIQVLCGYHRVPVVLYFALTAAGSILWLMFLTLLIYLFHLTVLEAGKAAMVLQAGMLMGLLFIVVYKLFLLRVQ